MLRRFADARLRRDLDKALNARDQARDTARRLFRRLQAARAEAATYKALTERWRAIAQGAQTELTAVRQQLAEIAALHTDSPAGVCPSCYRLADSSDTDDGLVDWPCPTLQAMGIEPHTPVIVRARTQETHR